ncbi:N-lysine methyltransferase SMYD2-like [Amphiura filiformis]|uniref:N-lysine methyltransferase SMYD2-like n=1 Tax=Amphiura filiformis TaxID=82378 RepID=UPI003B21C94C
MLKISDKIEVFLHEKQPDLGSQRGVRAKYDIPVGDSLLREQPVAWILSASERESYCHYCFVELDDVILCSRCKFARYCGEECKKLDETFHKNECKGLQDLSPLVPSSSVRLLARMAQLRCEETIVTKAENKTVETVAFPSKVSELQSNTSHLAKHQFLSGLETFQSYLRQSKVPDDVDVAMEIYGQIECNSFDVLDMEQKSIGAAIFLKASMFNHSCEANCIAVFDGNVVEIRSIMEIKAGQECVISYCELLAPTHERQKKLMDQFHFTCICHRCQEHQKMESGKEVKDAKPSDQTKQQSEQDLEKQSLDMLKEVEELSNNGNILCFYLKNK